VEPASRLADVIRRIASGVYLVEHDGAGELLYIAGPSGDRWVFWNGEVYHGGLRAGQTADDDSADPATVFGSGPRVSANAAISINAPMPARVSRILVEPGARVKKGETLIVLEAMKMELPIRAPGDASVTGVHCREGELVQSDAVLIDLGQP
jgi:biotin carboxyl carrier protein